MTTTEIIASLPDLPRTHRHGGIAPRDHPRGQGAQDAPARRDHPAAADVDARGDEDVRREPYALADADRRGDHGHAAIVVVVARRAEEAVLAHGRMGADADLVHAIAVDLLAEAGVIAHLQVPGRPDPRRGIRMH